MTNKVLFIGIDGFDLRLADWYDLPFWNDIRDELTVITVEKPDPIDTGDIATASSPRLWGRIYTGCHPHTSGILGFWEKLNDDGEVVRAKKSNEWIQENRCEKLVFATDVRVPTMWEHISNAGRSIGLTTPWFSYPLSRDLRDHIDNEGLWALSDFPFPMGHDFMEVEKVARPAEAYPDEDFQDQVGAGFTIPNMVRENPGDTYDLMLKQDRDRYDYTEEQLESRGTPDFCTVLTRSTDGLAHKYRLDEDIRSHYPDRVQDGVTNMKRVFEVNMTGIHRLWEAGDFDHLVIGGDHGCGLEMTNDGPVFEGDDHEWPGYFVVYSDDAPDGRSVKASYEDIAPTVLDLMNIDIPDVIEGTPVIGEAKVKDRLSDLGYMND